MMLLCKILKIVIMMRKDKKLKTYLQMNRIIV